MDPELRATQQLSVCPPPLQTWLHVCGKQKVSHGPRSSRKHALLGEPHNSCHFRPLNSRQSFCQMTFSCVWNVNVYRRGVCGGDSRTHLPPSGPLGSGCLSVQKSASRWSHPLLMFIPPDRSRLCLSSPLFTVMESVYVTQM